MNTIQMMAHRPLPSLGAPVEYEHGELSARSSRNPSGRTERLVLAHSTIYPGTSRAIWVHVPPRFDPSVPLNFCVFQDGWLYLDQDGPVRGGIVLDNLHGLGLLPPTAGIFVDPGVMPEGTPPPVPHETWIKQRNIEYDPFSGTYGTFLRSDVLPLVQKRIGITLDMSREGNFICGGSSGGNCAFATAWFHADLFEASIIFVSSFAQIPGGNPVPRALAERGAASRKLRTFMQIAHRDLNWDQPERNCRFYGRSAAAPDYGGTPRCARLPHSVGFRVNAQPRTCAWRLHC